VIEHYIPMNHVHSKLRRECSYNVERQTVPASQIVKSSCSHVVDQVAVFVVIADVKVENNLCHIHNCFLPRDSNYAERVICYRPFVRLSVMTGGSVKQVELRI